jgi:hypothetical protein
MNAKEIAEFNAYLRACTDAQVAGVLQKEKAAGRKAYAQLAREEDDRRSQALSRGWRLDRY